MKTVRIAELKSRLSEYLRGVRQGESLTVPDRETPVARIVPREPRAVTLTLRPPAPGAPKPGTVHLPTPLALRKDIFALLLQERAER